jgi:hypothetical protein
MCCLSENSDRANCRAAYKKHNMAVHLVKARVFLYGFQGETEACQIRDCARSESQQIFQG